MYNKYIIKEVFKTKTKDEKLKILFKKTLK